MSRTRWIVLFVLGALSLLVGIGLFLGSELTPSGSYSSIAAGDSAFNAFRVADAEGHYREAVALSSAGVFDSALDVFQTTEAMLRLARVVSAQGRQEEADSLAREVLEINERKSGPRSEDLINVLEKLSEFYESVYEDSMSEACDTRAISIARRVEPAHRRSIEIQERRELYGRAGAAAKFLELGDSYLRGDRGALAEAAYDRALAMQESEFDKEDARLYETLYKMALARAAAGKFGRAIDSYRLLHARQESKVGPSSPQLIVLLEGMADIEFARGGYVEAESLFTRILAIREAYLGREHPELVRTLCDLAESKAALQHFDEGIRVQRRALDIDRRLYNPSHPRIANHMLRLGSFEAAVGRISEAQNSCRQALDIFTTTLGRNHDRTLECRETLEEMNKKARGQRPRAAPSAKEDFDEEAIGAVETPGISFV